uniref:B30.2/SPRY domain-containing protein n=1 Tax=Salmo trutta TaxID=8032 RepID=A0A673YWM5_SALTR
MVRCTERSQAELIEEKQKAAEKRAEGLIEELEQEITELKRGSTELEQLSDIDDQLIFLQRSPSLCIILSPTKNCFLKSEVPLDPDTANPILILSKDRKQVKCVDIKQNHPANPERFEIHPCVLGKEGFSSGRMARESIKRNGWNLLSPVKGSWTVELRGGEYIADDEPHVPLSLRVKPGKVGVFVDYEGGEVSFYDVEARSHIYSFTGCTFTERLHPFFSTGYNPSNTTHLIISPIKSD